MSTLSPVAEANVAALVSKEAHFRRFIMRTVLPSALFCTLPELVIAVLSFGVTVWLHRTHNDVNDVMFHLCTIMILFTAFMMVMWIVTIRDKIHKLIKDYEVAIGEREPDEKQ